MSDVVNDLNQVANDIGTTHPCCGDVCIAAAVYVAELEQQLDVISVENIRIVLEAKQCHEQNDRLVTEHYELRRELAELREAIRWAIPLISGQPSITGKLAAILESSKEGG